ncbi:MAG: glycosyltransferase [Planctomycetota bacterium]|nr:glycosyltransferase [Planctomycetota bacterium]
MVFIPTYNELGNVERLHREISDLGLELDIVFMDDNSTDGTGKLLDKMSESHANLRILHRKGKLGVGSAHADGIRYAYEQGYDTLVTMDCDFTHMPSDIPRMIEAARDKDLAVGSRFLKKGSLPGWNLMRRSLTLFGHLQTKYLLGVKFDATGGFRVYRLKRIQQELFGLVTSGSYAFFFESLFILSNAGCSIAEVPIVLPARTYGHSKMSLLDAARSFRFLVTLWVERQFNPGRFRPAKSVPIDPALVDPQDWDSYWCRKDKITGFIYEFIAGIYRRQFIKRNLEIAVRRHFRPGSNLLHAGCGSGQVDCDLHHRYDITAVDVSPQALFLYSQNNPRAAHIEHASIFAIPEPDRSFDGVYNLGVVEHFTHHDIDRMLREFHRILRPGGKIVIFWPHKHASSVMVLKAAHFFMKRVMGNDIALHPPEISLPDSKRAACAALTRSGFEPAGYRFDMNDLYVQAVVVGSKPSEVGAPRESSAPVKKASSPNPVPADIV